MSSAERERAVVDAVPKQLLVGGRWRPAAQDATFKVEDPATGSVLCEVSDASTVDGTTALDAAAAAQNEWAQHPARARAEILRRAHELLIERQDDLGLLMTMEMGKPLTEAKGEIAYAAEFFRWFSEEAARIDGDYYESPDGKTRFLVKRQPVGPSLLITPWNFPMAMGTRKIGPAIAAGCTMIVKPAPDTPLSMLALAGILGEAGLPDGVLSVLPTTRAGELVEPLLTDGRVRKLSFTGSTAVGRTLLSQASAKVLRTSMELGGNAPFVVFEDADLDVAVDGAMVAKMRNAGEACTAANRFYVQKNVIDEFGRRLAERMSAMQVGRGTEDGVALGPLINAAAVSKVNELVDDAIGHGAKTVIGDGPVDGPGHFYSPTVLTDVSLQSRMATEEIFGPVAPLLPFRNEDEVQALANDTEFGLVSYVFTRDLDRALRMADRIESGMVGINSGLVSNAAAPFGGVKQSGLGREGGKTGIEEFLDVKYIGIAKPTS